MTSRERALALSESLHSKFTGLPLPKPLCVERIAAAINEAVAEAFEEAARDCDYAQCDRLAERIRERARKEKP